MSGDWGWSGSVRRRAWWAVLALVATGGPLVVGPAASAEAIDEVDTSAELVAAVTDPITTNVVLTADLTMAAEAQRPDGSEPLLIDGAGFTITGTPGVLGIFAGQGPNDLTLFDLTMTGFTRPAIAWGDGVLAVTGSTFRDNHGQGAVQTAGSIEVITDSMFVDNSTAFGGAAISDATVFDPTFRRTMTISGSRFERNTSRFAGAIYSDDVIIDTTSFVDNSATQDGGAIQSAGPVDLDRVTFSGNEAGWSGGAINDSGQSGLVVARGTTFADNTAGILGGAVLAPEARLTNSTVTGNQADQGGGIEAGSVTLTYATVAGNTAAKGANLFDDQGAFGTTPDFLTSFASVVADPLGGGANCDVDGTVVPDRLISLGANAEGGGDSCGFDAADDQAAIADIGLGALADNGGPTSTRQPSAGSVLMDAVPAERCLEGPAATVSLDQRGIARPQGGGCDIGAVERAVVAPPTSTTAPGPPTTRFEVVGAQLPAAVPASPRPGSPSYAG